MSRNNLGSNNDTQIEKEIKNAFQELRTIGIVDDFSVDGGRIKYRINLIKMLLYYLTSPVFFFPKKALDSIGFFKTNDKELKILLLISYLQDVYYTENNSSLVKQMSDEVISSYYNFFSDSNIGSPDRFGDDYYFNLPLNDKIKHVFVENIDMILKHGLIINSTDTDEPTVLDLEFAAEACAYEGTSFCIDEISKRSDYPRNIIIDNIWKLMKIGVLRIKM